MQMENTANVTGNVHIFDEAFYMPQLQRSRRIWLYLPPDYSSSRNSYPVLYMHDGQNLFDAATAFGGEEWGVDETMDTVKNKCIIVGIDNGGAKRINEYNFYDTDEHGAGEGRAYVSFIVDTLKPCIDKTYRTLPGRGHTFTAGSSLGALISFYAAFYYPQVFGGAGIFSPAFWIVPHIAEEMKAKAEENRQFAQRFYFYAGEKEEKLITEKTGMITDLLKPFPHYTIKKVLDPGGSHSEATWRAAFPHFYHWLFRPQRTSRQKAGT